MSNFQRTRSKVWWGNSPPNIGSPLPMGSRRVSIHEEEWEPQLPRWSPEEDLSSPAGNQTPPGERNSTPHSHKSQDSGFSDSDSSPAQPAQPQAAPQVPPTPHNCTRNSEAATPRHAHYNETPMRNIIKTPRDLHNYIEAHCDVGHAVFDSVSQDHCGTPGNPIRVTITPHKNINNNNIVVEKCSEKKNIPVRERLFQRHAGYNRSFHSLRKYRQKDIEEEETHSLGYIDLMKDEEECAGEKSFSNRKMKDSFYLKKSKSKHKCVKEKQSKGIFGLIPKKNDSIKTIYDITEDSERVPSLGLPGSPVVLDNGESRELNPMRRITPPMQFRDDRSRQDAFESSQEEIYFADEEISNMCTSTPKSMFSDSQRGGNMRPTNLLHNFNKSANETLSFLESSATYVTPLERACQAQEAPLQQWLCDLAGSMEGEVGTLLQSKPIGRQEQKTISQASSTITGNIRKVHTHALIITHMARTTLKELETANSTTVKEKHSDINSIAANMNEFIMTHSITLKVRPPSETPERWNQISKTLESNIHKAREICEDISLEVRETKPDVVVLRKNLESLYEIFQDTTKALLTQQMLTLVGLLEDPPSDTMLKSILTSLGQLGRCSSENESIPHCSIPLVSCGVPRALLELIITTTKSSIKALSFRALATICNTAEAVEQFDSAGGLEILCEVLGERNVPEPQTREVVTVLAQVTAPWVKGQHNLGSLNKHISTILSSLTSILSSTQCCQLLLLCSAALVNVIRSVRGEGRGSSQVIDALRKHQTVDVILEAVKKKGPQASIFLQEQVSSLLDLLTSCSDGRLLVSQCPTSCVALLCFLRPVSPVTPHPTARSGLQQAEERLLRHTTEALARLCTIGEVCDKVIQLEGPSRLIRVILSHPPRVPLVSMLRTLRSLHHHSPKCLPSHSNPHMAHMIQLPLMQAVSFYQHPQTIMEESYV